MLRRSSLFSEVPGLVHGFTTREGPPWVSPELGLDLGPGADARTWGWVSDQLGLPRAPIALVSQVHGADVRSVTEGGSAGEADALITETPGLLLAVRVADCVPVLVADLDHQGRAQRVAAIHAGWRGLAAGTIPAALAALTALGPATGRRLAALGPCIGLDAYEVGAEVVEGVGARVPTAVFVRPGRRPGHWQVDLKAAAAWQLRQGGADRVELSPWCTHRDPKLHSFRRDAQASGRLAALVGLLC